MPKSQPCLVTTISVVVGSLADALRAANQLSDYASKTLKLPLVLAETRAPSKEERQMFEDLD